MPDLTRRQLLQLAVVGIPPFARAKGGAPAYRIIDPHVHVWKHDPRWPFAPDAKVPDRDATPETLLSSV